MRLSNIVSSTSSTVYRTTYYSTIEPLGVPGAALLEHTLPAAWLQLDKATMPY